MFGVSLQGVPVLLRQAHQISLAVCLRDTSPRESIVEE